MLWDAIARTAAASGSHLAVASDDACITYDELVQNVDALAVRLEEAGVGPGHVVLAYLGNEPAFAVALLATAKLGAAYAPLDVGLTDAEAAGILALTRAAMVVGGAESAARCHKFGLRHVLLDASGVLAGGDLEGAAAPSVDPSIGCIQFSSGTSGAPKGILLSHEAFFYRSHYLLGPLGLGKSDRTLCTMPLSHTHGAECLLLPTLLAGGTVYLKPPKLSFPLYVLEELERLRITFFSTIPQFYDFATKLAVARSPGPDSGSGGPAPGSAPSASGGPDLSALRLPFGGSAPLAKSTAEAFRAKYGVHIRQGYGLAELSVICVNMHDGERIVYDSVGKVLEGVEWRTDSEGELLVRSKAMFSGYLNAEEQTREKLRDGWLHTGDVVTIDDDGLFRIVGRKEDFIKVNGFKVYAAEVEKALIALEWVKECAVVGEKDERGAERLVAHVVPTDWTRVPEVMEREMARHLVGRISDYKLPKRYVTWPELPKSAMGKILKSKLEGPDAS